MITAAHCVEGYVSAGRWSITVGEQNRGIPEDHEQSIQVMDIVTHKDFRVKELYQFDPLLHVFTLST